MHKAAAQAIGCTAADYDECMYTPWCSTAPSAASVPLSLLTSRAASASSKALLVARMLFSVSLGELIASGGLVSLWYVPALQCQLKTLPFRILSAKGEIHHVDHAVAAQDGGQLQK